MRLDMLPPCTWYQPRLLAHRSKSPSGRLRRARAYAYLPLSIDERTHLLTRSFRQSAPGRLLMNQQFKSLSGKRRNPARLETPRQFRA
eukprot:7164080-Pyramimonas_sp.AAC.1